MSYSVVFNSTIYTFYDYSLYVETKVQCKLLCPYGKNNVYDHIHPTYILK